MKIAFLDFEASSLGSASYPIEIGWVYADGQGEEHLIRPCLGWTDWSEVSEQIHHISREQLACDGKDAADVARRAYACLKDCTIFSDNPAWEQHWLETLLQTAGLPALKVYDVWLSYVAEIERSAHPNAAILAMRAVEKATMERNTVHRALSDATDLWTRWRAAVEACGRD